MIRILKIGKITPLIGGKPLLMLACEVKNKFSPSHYNSYSNYILSSKSISEKYTILKTDTAIIKPRTYYIDSLETNQKIVSIYSNYPEDESAVEIIDDIFIISHNQIYIVDDLSIIRDLKLRKLI